MLPRLPHRFAFNLKKLEHLELQIIKFHSRISLKYHVNYRPFWNWVSENPLTRSIAFKNYLSFGTLYLWESLFPTMKIVKCKNPSLLNDSQLEKILGTTVWNYT